MAFFRKLVIYLEVKFSGFTNCVGYIIKNCDCVSQRTWREMVVAYCMVLLQHFREGIAENNENPQSALSILGQDSNQGPFEYEKGALRAYATFDLRA